MKRDLWVSDTVKVRRNIVILKAGMGQSFPSARDRQS